MRLSFGAPFLGALAAFLDSNIAVISARRLLPSLLSTPRTSSELAERGCHALGELRIGIQHRRDSLDRVALVEQKREELIAHHCLEVRERKSATGIFAHMLKQAEAALVGDTLGHADVEESADRRLARAALRNVPGQLLDPLGDEGAIDRVDAWPVTWRVRRRP